MNRLSSVCRRRQQASRGPEIGAPYGSDTSKLVRAAVPSVVFGPGDLAQAHIRDEWVDIDEVALAAAILADTVMNFRRE
jgi:succinyl-diaminopimelate desuccinylase